MPTTKSVVAKPRCSSPYSAAFEHARVDQVGAYQGHVDAILLRGLQLVAQRLVESDGTKLAGTVILREERHVEQVSKNSLFPELPPHLPPVGGNLRWTLANPPARQAQEPPSFAVNDTTTTTRRHKGPNRTASCSNVSLAFLSCASASSLAKHGGFVLWCDRQLEQIFNKIATHFDSKGELLWKASGLFFYEICATCDLEAFSWNSKSFVFVFLFFVFF